MILFGASCSLHKRNVLRFHYETVIYDDEKRYDVWKIGKLQQISYTKMSQVHTCARI